MSTSYRQQAEQQLLDLLSVFPSLTGCACVTTPEGRVQVQALNGEMVDVTEWVRQTERTLKLKAFRLREVEGRR